MHHALLAGMFAAPGLKQSKIDGDLLSIEQPKAVAERIIAEFSGVHVGSVGVGRDLPTSDVHFYSHIRPEVSELAKHWSATTGTLDLAPV